MTPSETYYENLAKTTMKNLEKRHFECHYCKTAQEAVKLASELVPSDSTVSFGGSMTLAESGMADILKQRSDITLLDRSKAGSPEEVKEIYHKSLNADYYFMSSNAITVEGELVNIDGTGNRVGALIYGPEHVIILAGMNKVSPSLEEGSFPCEKRGFSPQCQPAEPEHSLRRYRTLFRLFKSGLYLLPYRHYQKKCSGKTD